MCDPVTIAIGATVASGAFSAYSSMQQGQFEAAQARANAKIAGYQRDQALEQGRFDANQIRQKAGALLGLQRARLAANGADLSSGSALDLQVDTARGGEHDAQTRLQNAAYQGWGYGVQQQNYLTQAKAAKWSGNMGAVGSILSTAASVASQGAKMGGSGGGGGLGSSAPKLGYSLPGFDSDLTYRGMTFGGRQ